MGSRGSRGVDEGGLVVRFRARNCNCGARERCRYCGWANRRVARRVGVRRDIVVVVDGRRGRSGVDALRMS
jgi:hypothetical protein